MKGATYVFIFILVITPISANEKICKSVYYFILANQYNYTEQEYLSLLEKNNISLEELDIYRFNYNSLCSNYTGIISWPK